MKIEKDIQIAQILIDIETKRERERDVQIEVEIEMQIKDNRQENRSIDAGLGVENNCMDIDT